MQGNSFDKYETKFFKLLNDMADPVLKHTAGQCIEMNALKRMLILRDAIQSYIKKLRPHGSLKQRQQNIISEWTDVEESQMHFNLAFTLRGFSTENEESRLYLFLFQRKKKLRMNREYHLSSLQSLDQIIFRIRTGEQYTEISILDSVFSDLINIPLHQISENSKIHLNTRINNDNCYLSADIVLEMNNYLKNWLLHHKYNQCIEQDQRYTHLNPYLLEELSKLSEMVIQNKLNSEEMLLNVLFTNNPILQKVNRKLPNWLDQCLMLANYQYGSKINQEVKVFKIQQEIHQHSGIMSTYKNYKDGIIQASVDMSSLMIQPQDAKIIIMRDEYFTIVSMDFAEPLFINNNECLKFKLCIEDQDVTGLYSIQSPAYFLGLLPSIQVLSTNELRVPQKIKLKHIYCQFEIVFSVSDFAKFEFFRKNILKLQKELDDIEQAPNKDQQGTKQLIQKLNSIKKRQLQAQSTAEMSSKPPPPPGMSYKPPPPPGIPDIRAPRQTNQAESFSNARLTKTMNHSSNAAINASRGQGESIPQALAQSTCLTNRNKIQTNSQPHKNSPSGSFPFRR